MRLNFDLEKDKLKDLLLLLSNIYLPILGLIWVCFHIYIRFIIKRSSYSFDELKDYVSLKLFILFVAFVIVHILILIISIVIVLKRKSGYKNESVFYKISNYLSIVLNKIYWRPLEYIHDMVAPYIAGSGRFFIYLETKWKTKRFTYIAIATFDVFPKIIVATIFFLETIFFNSVYIFIYALMFMIVPIFFSIFLKLFLSFAERNAPILKEYFESIKGISDPVYDTNGKIAYYDTYEIVVKPEYIDVINPNEEMELLLQLRLIL